jgi:hypothetical protein
MKELTGEKLTKTGPGAAGQLKRFLLISAFAAAFARPMPMDADITFRTKVYSPRSLNPSPSPAQMTMIRRAINFLVNNPGLPKHPIRRYYSDPNLLAEVIFDNPRIKNYRGIALAQGKEIILSSDNTFVQYLGNFIHEFIHVDISERYLDVVNYSFLTPDDFAFQYLMEEAFANMLNV